MGLRSGTDFTKTNALEVIRARPPQQEPEFLYTQKPDFGRVPDYLVQAKRQAQEAAASKAAAEERQIAEVGLIRQVCRDMQDGGEVRGAPWKGRQPGACRNCSLRTWVRQCWRRLCKGYQKVLGV